MTPMKTVIKTSISRLRMRLWSSFIFIALALGSLALTQRAQAVTPAPDGGYPGGNTAEGQNALLGLTTGTYNTAVGWFSLRSNTTGQFNTALGAGALLANVGNPSSLEGVQNTATGAAALLSNTTGYSNTANGNFALLLNIGGSDNTAVGVTALRNTTGGANTAVGLGAGGNVTTGSFNVYIGTDVGGVADEVGHTYISNISSTVQPPGTDVEYVTVNLNTKLLGHSSSSRRYKEDIRPMTNVSEALYRLKPVTY